MSDASLLLQQLEILQDDVSKKVGAKLVKKTNRKRRRKKQKKAKRKQSDMVQVASEEVKRKKNYQHNLQKIVSSTNTDVSVNFVKKVRRCVFVSQSSNLVSDPCVDSVLHQVLT